MKVLVTGGSGYVGRNLVTSLASDGHTVIVLDINHTPSSHMVKGVSYIQGHTKDIDSMGYVIDYSIDVVYHLGEYSRVAPSFDEPDKVFDQNIKGSFEILEFCRKGNIPLVYAASSTRMAQEGPGHSPYSFFKSTIVDLIKNYNVWYGLQYSICYFYNVYGNRWTLPSKSKWNSVITIFEGQFLNNKPLTICGDGLQERDFTHVNDIVDGLTLASGNVENEEYHFGSGEKFSIVDVAKMFGGELEYIEGRRGDRKSSLADISNSKEKLGWEPTTFLKEWIQEVKNYKSILEDKKKVKSKLELGKI